MGNDVCSDRRHPRPQEVPDVMGVFASLRLIAAAAIGAIGMFIPVPRAAGTTWASVGTILADVCLTRLAVTAGIWVSGLRFHSFALAAALPGLTKRRPGHAGGTRPYSGGECA